MSWCAADERLLLDLLELDTAGPLESGRPGSLAEAQRRYAAAARELGFRTVCHEPAPAEALAGDLVPAPVLAAAGPGFLAAQPNLVLALGDGGPADTVVLNCHLDTVAGAVPVASSGGVVTGRGAVDDKGPAVAFLAAVRGALRRLPALPRRVRVLIHAVGGEEGGAMGVYGTRAVVAAGHTGRLTVVAEPTRGVFVDRCTASMTLRLRVRGRGAIDDTPDLGENATLLLGFLAVWIARRVAPAVGRAGATTCLAGLHTGTAHNRVYGTGDLLVNIAYGHQDVAAEVERIVAAELAAAVAGFTAEFGAEPATSATAMAADRILEATWLKRGLPTLDNRDQEMEALLEAAGLPRYDEHDPAGVRPFTCDAIWLGGPGRHVVVCGPGDLAANNAHADGEFVALADLADYADRLACLLVLFAERDRPDPME